MLRPDKNFRMDKQSKRTLATIMDPAQYTAVKAALIQAQLYSAIQPRKERRNTTPADAPAAV